MAKLIISKDAHLLIRSAITTEHPTLKDLLTAHPNGLKDDQLSTDHPFRVNFDNGTYLRIRDQARTEWVINSNDAFEYLPRPEDRKPCEICKTKLNWIFGIRNRINGNTMKIGRECLSHFAIHRDINGRSIDEITREGLRLRKYESLATRIGDVDTFLREWPQYLEHQPILVPDPTASRYEKTTDRFRDIVENFLSDKSQKDNQNMLEELKKLAKDRDELARKIDTYVAANQEDPMCVTMQQMRDLERSMKAKAYSDLKERLKKTGRIDLRTARYIRNPRFIESLLAPIREPLKQQHDIQLLGYKEEANAVEFRFPKYTNLVLQTDYPDFLLECGGPAFGEPLEQDEPQLMHNAQIRNPQAIEEALYRLHGRLEVKGLQLAEAPRYGIDAAIFHSYNDYFVHDVSRDLYLQVKLTPVLDQFKALLMAPDSGGLTDYQAFVTSNGRPWAKPDFFDQMKQRSQ